MGKFKSLAACAAIFCVLLFTTRATAQTFSTFPREKLEKVSFCNGMQTETYSPVAGNFTFNLEEQSTVYSFMLGRWVASPTSLRASYKFEESWMILRVFPDRSIRIALYTIEYTDVRADPPLTNIFAETGFFNIKIPHMWYQLPKPENMGAVVVLNEIRVNGKYISNEPNGLEITLRFGN